MPVARRKTAAPISPIALEAVRRIDALFEIERSINGQAADQRRAVRQQLSAPLVTDLESWMRGQRAKLSRDNDVAKAMEYMLKRWPAFARFLDDGRICLSNNAAERALRGIGLGRKSWRRLRSRWTARSRHVWPHRHGKNERRGSASLACRCPRPHCRAPGSPDR
jgi:hypothetical protein